MKPETQEWIDKAAGDRKVARREIQTVDPVWNVVCFKVRTFSFATHCAPLERKIEPLNMDFQWLATSVLIDCSSKAVTI